MNLKITYILLIIVALSFSGCMEDYLEEEAFNDFTEANFYTSDDDFVFIVNGVYEPLDGVQSDLVFQNSWYSAVGSAADFNNFDEFDNVQLPSMVSGIWNDMYTGITRSNSALERMSEYQFTDMNLGTRLEAETRFLRAYYYFNLVRLYGDVPFIDEALTNFSSIDDVVNASAVPRTSTETIYQAIISDLQFAAANLSTLEDMRGTPDMGRASQEAANTVLGLVYLTRGDYADAETTLLQVEGSSGLELTPDYSCVTGSNTIEAIFEIQFAGESASSRQALANAIVPKGAPGISPEEPTGNIYAELRFFHSFDTADARYKAFFRTSYEDDGTVNWWQFAEPMPHFKKYEDPDDDTSPINQPLFRYADLLLMIAEAKVQNGKPVSEAEPYINQVRNRAGIPDITTGLTPEQFMDSLFVERNKELCLEGHEFFDAKRFGKLISEVQASVQYNEDFKSMYPDTAVLATPRAADVNIDETNLLWPLPTNTLERNDAINENNPGY